MSDKKNILFVDDEENVLSSMRRMLRKNAAQWDMAFANSGAEAVELAKTKNFAVVVSDMRMPEMDGLETLSTIKDISPDTVRIMLTGNADQLTAINAINEGEIFRFFTKPCDRGTLIKGIESAIRQHNLITAEKELLEQTLAGSLRVLIDARALSGDDATGPSKLVRKWAKEAAKGLNIKPAWPLEMAANLFDIARFAIPAELTLKIKLGKDLTSAEQNILDNMPQNSHDLIANIPRLSKIANIVLHHMRGFDGSGLPKNGPVGAELPLESRVLKIVHDAAKHHIKGATLAESFQILEGDPAYDPGLLDRIRSYLLNAAFDGKEGEEMETIPLAVQSLEPGMLIAGNVEGENGNLLLAAGERISDVQIALLRNWVACGTFSGKVDVSLPSSRVDAMLSVA
jgi:response regulator RpfG family c-di-GMP phosphodiesterase